MNDNLTNDLSTKDISTTKAVEDDSAWASVVTPLSAEDLMGFCADTERFFRINPMLVFTKWEQTSDNCFSFSGENSSQEKAFDYDKVLAAIYSFYDHFIKSFSMVCKPGCHVCCTVNIVATSLEAGHLLCSSSFDDLDLKKLLSSATTGPVYRPSLSTNQIADFCLRQEEIPSDRVEHGEGVCPFLDQEGLCGVYENRPFACRAMSSREVCQHGGEADMEPFLVTVNLAIYQIIEHLDKEGVSGNLLDVLSELVNNQSVSTGTVNGLISNRAFPGFLVSPNEQGRFRAFMRRLTDFQVGDTTLGAFLDNTSG
jgi:Fe-S-cluster containining protein